MSIEKQVRRELRRVAFWRFVTALLCLPGSLLAGIGQLFSRGAQFFNDISDSTFYFEADAARRYRALTGVDLGFAASGSLDRYAGTTEKALAVAEKDEFGDEDDD